MIRRDFVMRMIDEFGKNLSLIVGLKKDGNYDDALKKIDEVFEGMFKIDSNIINSVSVDGFLDFLQKDLEFNDDYLKMVSDLLFEEGMIYHERGDPFYAQNILEKAKVLITYLMNSGSTFSFDWCEKLSIIEEKLST